MDLEGKYMTVEEVAQQYNMSLAWVRRLAQSGRFPNARRAGKRTWLIPVEDVEAYLSTRREAGRPKGSAKQ